jgi:uridine kinase
MISVLLDRYEQKKYQSGLKFVLYVAVRKLFACDVNYSHSIDKGLYTKIITDKVLTDTDINNLKIEMDKIIAADAKITRKVVTKKDAYDFYIKTHEDEKAGNILNLSSKTVTLFELEGYYNYFMSDMPASTGILNHYSLTYLNNNNLVLNYPMDENYTVPEYVPQDMIIKSFDEYSKWSDKLKVKYVADLNTIIANSGIKAFIKKNDIIMDNQIYEAAITIKKEHKKIILLGGPSSSGKTTTTRKLSLYLSAIGLNPLYISLDNYFKDRKETPKDENGNYDYECIEAIDLELFNKQLTEMLEGKKVNIPIYNFLTGEKEFKNKFIELKENDIILIEGLHCLNDKLTSTIEASNKIKIYISPFIPLNIDRHNHLSTVDIRLMRRIVRDNRTRGYSVTDTLKSWDSVRNGETKYVFPFTNEANMIINTSYVYELGVLRVYVEPLLYSVPIDSKYYNESRRLINELQMFFPIPSEYLGDSNILREFIGGSYFEEG